MLQGTQSADVTAFSYRNDLARPKLVVHSPLMLALCDIAETVAARQSTVMLLGETGCGKERVARHIHERSDRADQPFVPVDCAALSETLFESQLFGHVRGAFTGALRESLGFIRAADGGTLFLDEIGELPLLLQSKLLRVLQERQVVPVGETRALPVNIRIITATSRDLADMVRTGTFRQDLYFRLNVVVLQIPPLRQRVEEILPLAEHFLANHAAVYDEPQKSLTPQAADLLRQYPWPGNVRELANAIEHAHVLATDDHIDTADLPLWLLHSHDAGTGGQGEFDLRAVERITIAAALRKVRNNKSAASRLLGINVQRLNRRITSLKITL